MLTYLLALVNPASVGQQILAAAFLTSVGWYPLCPTLISWQTLSWLLSPADCSLLPPSVDCFSGTFLPSSSSGLTALFMGFAPPPKKQRDFLTGTHTHRNEYHLSCHSCYIVLGEEMGTTKKYSIALRDVIKENYTVFINNNLFAHS